MQMLMDNALYGTRQLLSCKYLTSMIKEHEQEVKDTDRCHGSEYHYTGSCIYLLGNSGCHMYYGNPKHWIEEIKNLHYSMINSLSGELSPQIKDYWDKFTNMLKVQLKPSELASCQTIFDICETLKIKNVISFGNYNYLIEVFEIIEHIPCLEIVRDYSTKIKAIESQNVTKKGTLKRSTSGDDLLQDVSSVSNAKRHKLQNDPRQISGRHNEREIATTQEEGKQTDRRLVTAVSSTNEGKTQDFKLVAWNMQDDFITEHNSDKHTLQLPKLLTESGHSVNTVDKFGDSLLHALIKRDETYDMETPHKALQLAKLYIDNGHSVNVLDMHGDSLIHTLLKREIHDGKDILQLAALFVERGHSVNVVDKHEDSLLHTLLKRDESLGAQAAHNDDKNTLQLVELLLDAEHSVNVVDKYKDSLMHTLLKINYTNAHSDGKAILHVAKLFIENGHSVNVVDKHGDTLLKLLQQYEANGIGVMHNDEKNFSQLEELFKHV